MPPPGTIEEPLGLSLRLRLCKCWSSRWESPLLVDEESLKSQVGPWEKSPPDPPSGGGLGEGGLGPMGSTLKPSPLGGGGVPIKYKESHTSPEQTIIKGVKIHPTSSHLWLTISYGQYFFPAALLILPPTKEAIIIKITMFSSWKTAVTAGEHPR